VIEDPEERLLEENVSNISALIEVVVNKGLTTKEEFELLRKWYKSKIEELRLLSEEAARQKILPHENETFLTKVQTIITTIENRMFNINA